MSRQKPIEDYYGTKIEAEVVGHSVGFMVDLDLHPAHEDFFFASLFPTQARDLAKRLTDAADEIEGRS